MEVKMIKVTEKMINITHCEKKCVTLFPELSREWYAGFTSRRTGNFRPFRDATPGKDAPRQSQQAMIDVLSGEVKSKVGQAVFVNGEHGANVLTLKNNTTLQLIQTIPLGRKRIRVCRPEEKSDAIVTRQKNICLVATSADCPILVAGAKNDNQPAIGIAHCGWRSTVGGIIKEFVSSFEDLGFHKSDINFAIGPGICPKCFEVGPEVVAQMEKIIPPLFPTDSIFPDGNHINLKDAIFALIMEANGYNPENIELIDGLNTCCTKNNHERLFFSHRKEGANTGRFVGFITQ